MKILFGILLILLGIFLGLYLGVYVLFWGGIVGMYTGVTTGVFLVAVWGFVKTFVLAGLVGWGSFALLGASGIALISND